MNPSIRTFAPELNGNTDPQLLRVINRMFKLIYDLQDEQQQSPMMTKQAVISQLQLIGLLGPYGQLLLGSNAPQDPQLQNQTVGTLTSISANNAVSGLTMTISTPTTTPVINLSGTPNIDASNVITGTLAIARGGTNAATAVAALSNLGIGTRVDVAYAAGNFTASAGNWTVDAGDQTAFWYEIHNDLMTVGWYLSTTTTTAAPNFLTILIPASKTAAARVSAPILWTNRTANTDNIGGADVSGTGIKLYASATALTNWPTLTNTLYVIGEITFPIN